MGLRLLKTALVALVALIAGYVAALAIGLIAFDIFEVSTREGANAMGLAFFICPAVALVVAIVAAIRYFVASGRPASPSARKPWPRPVTAGGAALAGLLAGFLLQWILAGRSYETWAAAALVSFSPWIGALLLGGITLFFTRRGARPG